MFRKTLIAGLMVSIPGAAVSRAEIISIPITNPGAELGDTSGWSDPAGIFHASDAAPADAGDWFFETEEHLDLFSRPLSQMLDVSSWSGSIDDVILSVSMAASAGLAQTDGPDGAETWTYHVLPGLVFLDSDLNRLPIGLFGPAAVGDDSLTWTTRELRWADFDPVIWNQFKSGIAHIEVRLSGGWLNDQTFVFEDPPAGSIVDVPKVTRFDNVSVSLAVPEPGSLTLFALGLAAAFRRRTRILRGKAQGCAQSRHPLSPITHPQLFMEKQ